MNKDSNTSYKKYGYVVISNDNSVVATLKGTEKHILKYIHGELHTEIKREGQNANLIMRVRQEKRDIYKNNIMEACQCIQNVEGIIVAGNAELPKEVMSLLKNDKRILYPILGYVKTCSNNTNISLDEAINNSKGIVLGEITKEENNWTETMQDMIVNDCDRIVFGEEMITKCDADYILEYVLTNKKNIMNCKVRYIKNSKFLNDYGGIIGVLYYSGSAEYLNNEDILGYI
jgi:peptide subunit release factor 1 (eRF1)